MVNPKSATRSQQPKWNRTLAQHLSDEEQFESLKRWWKGNGSQLILVVVLAIGSWFGWQQWQDYREKQAAHASAIYDDMMELVGQQPMDALSDDDRQRLQDLAESLRADHKNSLYAQYASMMLARVAVADAEYEKAATLLQGVIDNSADDELVNVVRLRLARVEVTRKDYAKALEILDVEVPVAMTALYAELRGDIYYYQQDFAAAREAYQAALANLSEGESSALAILKLKLNQVLDGSAEETATPVDAVEAVQESEPGEGES